MPPGSANCWSTIIAASPKTASDTGIAAYCIGDVNAADRYLSLAKKDGYYKVNQPNDKLADQGKYYLSNLDQFKKAWNKEQQIRRG